MVDDGTVDRATVIKVLRAHAVEASLLPGQKHQDEMLLVKAEIIDVRTLPPRCGRRLLQYLSRTFNIPIHHFYNPLMCPPLPGEQTQ